MWKLRKAIVKQTKPVSIKPADFVEALDRFFPEHDVELGVMKPTKREPPTPEVKAIMVGLWKSGRFVARK